MTESWFLDGVRAFFALIDRAVYGLIGIVYGLIEDLANTTIFEASSIEEFAGKIYVILGLFMLFRLSFSFINYIINPDDFLDKSKGAQKIIVNVIIVLAMLIVTPKGFELLYDFQKAILDDQVLTRFILETNETTMSTSTTNLELKFSPVCSETISASTPGEYVAIMAFRPFYQLDEGETTSPEGYCQSGSNIKVSSYLKADIYNSAPDGVKDTYVVNYQFFISTIVGIGVLLVLISFAFDIAVRSLKLGFLQIIAPIPIISFIEPNSSKNGMFKKWLSNVGKTWASLFIRLGAIYFAVYIISLVGKATPVAGATWNSDRIWIELFILIGALIFAKQLPKLIEEISGIKFDSKIELNPFKKVNDQALGGKVIGNTIGAGAGAIGGGIAGFKAGAAVGDIKRGMAVGVIGGLRGGYTSPKGAFSKNMDQMYKSLTGSEMSKLSLGKMIMAGDTGTEKVQEMKDYLAASNEKLRNEQTNLNVATSISSDVGKRLKAKGVDLSDEGLSKATAEYGKYKGVDRSTLSDPEEIKKYDIAPKTLDEISRYQNAKSEEIKYRENITKIEKDIKTFGDEKAQRQRFYQVDSSPKEDVSKAKEKYDISDIVKKRGSK